ncbi:MAG: rRNA pseudouridine synthase [Myxococcales bacterium]|nr:rRNA pseudouridine synthase [Myxococcales bacterium]
MQKVLAAAGIAARRKAEDLITAGRVRVNGKVVTELGTRVDPDRDQVQVDGKHVQAAKKVYFVLNKPDGVVCSAEGDKDGEGRPTVLSLFPELPQRIYPVGRLDYHSRGVLILTNDGELAAALTHPRHEVSKTYHVKFQGRLEEQDLARLGQPITLEDGTVTRAAEEVSVIKDTDTNTWVQITLRQGLNRQVRRMGDAIGRPVLKLIRVAVGKLTADGLADGEFRPLTPTEVYDLMAEANPEPARPGKSGKPRRAAKTGPRPAKPAAADAASTARPAAKDRTSRAASVPAHAGARRPGGAAKAPAGARRSPGEPGSGGDRRPAGKPRAGAGRR